MPHHDDAERARLVEHARSAYTARSWTEAYEAFSSLEETEPSETLGSADLELFATSAYMLGKVPDMLAIEERAHHAYLAVGDSLGASRAALWLAGQLASRGKIPQASGWVEVADRLLTNAPENCVERGYLLLPSMLRHMMIEDFESVIKIGGRAADIGRQFGDPDLTALAAHTQARALLRLARTDEGLRLIDEVMISVTGARCSPMVTGLVYCSVLEGCFETHAIKRAATWTQSLTEWCGEQPDLVAFTGQCLAHRSEILRLQGAWTAAEEEARKADQAGARFAIAAQAHYQLAEIQRMRGDFDTAEATTRQVSVDGGDPMPGAALLKLALGRPDEAFAAVTGALAEAADPFIRTRLLPVLVEVAIATNHVPDAARAAKELSETAAHTQSEAHRAWAAHAEGRVALAENRITQAIVRLRNAKGLWQDLSMPYEVARSRVDVARAYLARGDLESVELECEAARAAFVELGAVPDIRTVDDLLREERSAWPAGLTNREVEVLRLLTSGATNRSIASDLVLSERTVDRHVSNVFTKIDVSTRSAATAWAIRNGLA